MPTPHQSSGRLSLTASSNIVYTDSMNPVNYDNDSIERITILGIQLTNPYLIPNMQQAYANLGIPM